MPRENPIQHIAAAFWRRRFGAVTCAGLALFTVLGLTGYLGAGRDDVFLSLWAGESLAKGLGAVNHNIERVEIGSSLLHTVLIAALAKAAPGHVFTLNKLVGLMCGCALFGVLHLHRGTFFRRLEQWQLPAFAFAVALTATNPSLLYWTLGGLETPFATLFLFVCGAHLTAHWQRPRLRDEVIAGLAAGLYALTRPEGFFLVLFGLIYLVLFRRLHESRGVPLLVPAIPAAAFTAVSLWRLLYFGQVFPNPVYAKTGSFAESFMNGVVYFRSFYTSSAFLLCALAGLLVLSLLYARTLWAALRSQPPAAASARLDGMAAAGLLVAVGLVAVLAGGDWMEHFRFFVVQIPLLTAIFASRVLAVAGCLWQRIQSATGRRALGAATFLLCLGLVAANASQSGLNVPRSLPRPNDADMADYRLRDVFPDWAGLDRRIMRLNRGLARDMDLLDPFFETVFPRLYGQTGRVVVATNQMGYFPYAIRHRFPGLDVAFVDTLGLCDKTIAHMPLPKDHIGLRDGKFPDEVLSGDVPLLSDYVRSKRPNMVYMLGYDPDMPRRAAVLRGLGYDQVWDKTGAMVFFNPAPSDA